MAPGLIQLYPGELAAAFSLCVSLSNLIHVLGNHRVAQSVEEGRTKGVVGNADKVKEARDSLWCLQPLLHLLHQVLLLVLRSPEHTTYSQESLSSSVSATGSLGLARQRVQR